MSTATHMSRNEEKGVREFYFSAETEEEIEEWKTFIDLARANAIYNDFVATYGRIKFPLGLDQAES